MADGHPRMPLTESQLHIIDEFPRMFHRARTRRFEDIELEAHELFLRGIGQSSAPTGTGRILTCYSSSVAMDIVSRTLAERGGQVALIHPTFDNIPDLLKARGLDLVPVSEEELDEGVLSNLGSQVSAVFVTTPNNPTGWVLGEQSFRRLVASCEQAGRVLVMDSCFRAQDERAQYDAYAILESSGVEWVIIEDTGKLWPMQELKVGFLAWGEHTKLDLEGAFSDVLLSVSPFVLLLVADLARDADAGGYVDFRRLIGENRRVLLDTIEGTSMVIADPDSRISVARVRLPDQGPTAEELNEALVREGVHMLPCDAFHWANPAEGKHHIRIALSREQQLIGQAARALKRVASYEAAREK